tara:strand:- start:9150 stop:9920 length:771 start_codon:yes stop_codon:yes gene_type:complete
MDLTDYLVKIKVKKNYNRLRGLNHIRDKSPCQDRTYYLKNENLNVMVLADGAGSAKFSKIGAAIITKFTANFINENFDYCLKNVNKKKFKDEFIKKCLNEINLFKKNGHSINDYASTLLFVAQKDENFFFGHIGDGGIGLKQGKKIELISAPENGETANSTFFITSDDAKHRIRFKKGKLKKNNSFVLMSDGAFDCVFDKSSLVFTNVLYQFIDWTKKEKELDVSIAILKNIKEFFIKKTFDDISLCIIDFTKSKN